MRIDQIIEENQPEVHKVLKNKLKKEKKEKQISFTEFKSMMGHDSYKRCNGAIRQVRHG